MSKKEHVVKSIIEMDDGLVISVRYIERLGPLNSDYGPKDKDFWGFDVHYASGHSDSFSFVSYEVAKKAHFTFAEAMRSR